VDHVVEHPRLLGRVAPAVARGRVEVRLLLAGGERRLEVDEPHGVVEVDDVDRRALALVRAGGVDEARAEADDPAVDGRALLLDVDVDQVLAGTDLQRAELVLQDLGAGGRARIQQRGVGARAERGRRRRCEGARSRQQDGSDGHQQADGDAKAVHLSPRVGRRTAPPATRARVTIALGGKNPQGV
jgi:hypothetical protein